MIEIDTSPAPPVVKRCGRPWPIVAVLLLLAGQIAGGVVLLIWRMFSIQRQISEIASGEAALQVPGGVVVSLGLLVLVVAAAIAALRILRRAENAWVNAMFVQTLDLALGLALHFSEGRFTGYVMMLYGVYAVVYLLIPGVQAAFLPPGGPDDPQSDG